MKVHLCLCSCKTKVRLNNKNHWNKYINGHNGRGKKNPKQSEFMKKNNPMFLESAKQKVSKARCGIKFSDKWKAKISEAKKGSKHTEETKKKIANHPFRQTEEYKQKQAKNSTGRRHTEQTKNQISKALKGRQFTMEHRENIAKTSKGRKWNEESKKKMSESRKGTSMGKDNPMWQGGLSFLPYLPSWTISLKNKIRNRDNYTCQNPPCNLNNSKSKLHVHHLDYNKKNCDSFNLISLCKQCHGKTINNRKHWYKFYSEIMEKRKIT